MRTYYLDVIQFNLFLSMILFIPIRYRYHIIPLERRKNLYVFVNFK